MDDDALEAAIPGEPGGPVPAAALAFAGLSPWPVAVALIAIALTLWWALVGANAAPQTSQQLAVKKDMAELAGLEQERPGRSIVVSSEPAGCLLDEMYDILTAFDDRLVDALKASVIRLVCVEWLLAQPDDAISSAARGARAERCLTLAVAQP